MSIVKYRESHYVTALDRYEHPGDLAEIAQIEFERNLSLNWIFPTKNFVAVLRVLLSQFLITLYSCLT